MKRVFNCDCVSLHVRVTNRAALTLYRDVLNYEIRDVDKSYYADKEDAYDMRLMFKKKDEEESKATEIDHTGKDVSDSYAEHNPKATPKVNDDSKPADEEQKEESSQASKNKKKRDKKKKNKAKQAQADNEEEKNTKE